MRDTTDSYLQFLHDDQTIRITPWGPNAFRVQSTLQSRFNNPESALIEDVDVEEGRVKITQGSPGQPRQIINGDISANVSPSGKITFKRHSTGTIVLEEFARNLSDIKAPMSSALSIKAREFHTHIGTEASQVIARFESQRPDERIFGMGQYQQPLLDLKGSELELAQRNSQASVPFAVSSLGYGFLWNNPGIGRATFGKNVMTFEARSSTILDYWVVVGDTPRELVRAYTAVTGRPPMMPDYGLGFWQSKLRYQTQEELLAVVHEHKKRELPLDVIVIDYFHWPHQGDWKFDKTFWPDPDAMIKEIQDMGVVVVVSIWPTVEVKSENYQYMLENNMLVKQDRGFPLGLDFPDNEKTVFFDSTNPDTRDFVWKQVKKNYWDKGIKSFWLDVAEPEYRLYDLDNYRYSTGPNLMVGNSYPKNYSRLFYEGMSSELGKQAPGNIVNLVRCAWAGSQKYGALLWSGDVPSSWQSLRNQFASGLNAGMAGISWWTVDIGGFHGADVKDPAFHELFIRWFQWATFLPVMRLHGFRLPQMPRHGTTGGSFCLSGSPNEVWSYGEEVYNICKTYMGVREKLKPYTKGLMEEAHQHGDPVIRPMFFEFPEDEYAWEVEDQYMFGDKYLVAPVFSAATRERKVYLPKGHKWRQVSVKNGLEEGDVVFGETVTVACPLDYIPVFAKVD